MDKIFHVTAEINLGARGLLFNCSLCSLPRHTRRRYIRIKFLIVIFYNNLCITIFSQSACALAAVTKTFFITLETVTGDVNH